MHENNVEQLAHRVAIKHLRIDMPTYDSASRGTHTLKDLLRTNCWPYTLRFVRWLTHGDEHEQAIKCDCLWFMLVAWARPSGLKVVNLAISKVLTVLYLSIKG